MGELYLYPLLLPLLEDWRHITVLEQKRFQLTTKRHSSDVVYQRRGVSFIRTAPDDDDDDDDGNS